MTKVIIIGGVAGGSKTAAKLKHLKPEYDITIYTKEQFVSYSACGFPFYIGGSIRDLDKLIIRTIDEFEQKGIHVKNFHEVLQILPNKKKVLIKNLKDDVEFYETYDKLVIATGAEPFIPKISGVDIEHVYTLRNMVDARNIKKRLLESENALIVGGNYIGVELMESFIKQSVTTTIVEANTHLMKFYDKDISNIIQDNIKIIQPLYTKIITSDTVTSLKKSDEKIEVFTKKGKHFYADIVVIAAGVKPCVKLAKDAGIEIGNTGAISVDNKMRTNIEDIWAVGDCVEKFNIVSKQWEYIPLGSTANKEGRVCALNIAGFEDEVFEGVLGSSVVKYFDYSMSKTGLSEVRARDVGFDVVSVLLTTLDKSKYMPDVKSITIKLLADKKTRKVLGVQCVGFGDADKRVNALTMALLKGSTIDEFVNTDITYAPAVSTSIDPILTAAHILIDKLSS